MAGWLIEHGQSLATAGASGAALDTRFAHSHRSLTLAGILMAGWLSLGSPLPPQLPRAPPSKRSEPLTHAHSSPEGWLIQLGQPIATASASGTALDKIHTANSHLLIAGPLLTARRSSSDSPLPPQVPRVPPSKRFMPLTHAPWSMMAGWLIEYGQSLATAGPSGAAFDTRFTPLTHARWLLDGWLIELGQSLPTAGASGAALETIRTDRSRLLVS
jgi:hypothetical protein